MSAEADTDSTLVSHLKRRGAIGSAWVVGLQGVTRAIALVRLFVVARLLAPSDFGLFSLASLVIALLDTVTQTGVNQVLIQRRDTPKRFFDTAWTIQALRGLFLSAVLLASGNLAAGFFGESELAPLIRVVALTPFLLGLVNVGTVRFQKELKLHKEFVFVVLPVAAEFFVAIAAAFVLRNAWALVYALIARAGVSVLLSFLLTRDRPRPRLGKDEALQIFAYGKWLFLFGMLVFAITQADRFVIGRLRSAQDVGVYYMAYVVATLPAVILSDILARVAMPVYAKLQHDTAALRRMFLQVLELGVLIVTPLAGMIAILPDYAPLLLGDKWTPTVPLLKILAIKGLVWSLAAATGGSLYLAVGRPDLNFKLNLSQLAVLGLCLYPATVWWGLSGAAVVVVVAAIAGYVLNIRVSLGITGVSFGEYLRATWTPLAGIVLVGAVVIAVRPVIERDLPPIGAALLSTVAIGLGYTGWLVLWRKTGVLQSFWRSVRTGLS